MIETDRAREVERRLEWLRGRLRARGADGALLSQRRNFSWLTLGGVNHVLLSTESGAVPLLVTLDEATALAPTNEADRIASEEVAGLPIGVHALPWEDPAAATAYAEARVGRIVADDELEEELRPERSRLGELDQQRLAELGRLADTALEAALTALEPGERESDAVAITEATLAAAGARVPVMLAAADDRLRRFRHPLPTDTTVRRRLMLVVVAERWGLHVAATRIRDFEPPDDELRRRDAAVREVERAILDATRPGATLGEVLAAAQAAYAEVGFPDEWRDHHQGGTIGYASREVIATPGDRTVVGSSMAVAWNPSIAGTKAEDTYLIGADGALRRMTTPG